VPSEERFSITIGLDATSGDSRLQVTPLSVEYSYREMTAPPLSAGGAKAIVSVWPEAAMDPIVGAVGGVEQEPTCETTLDATELADVEPTELVFVTVTVMVEPITSGSSAKHKLEVVAPLMSAVVPPLVRFHWIVVAVTSAPPVFQVPSSIVRVVPVVADPKIVGRPVLCGAVAAARIWNERVTDCAAT
jgi:hypothetical protein